MILNCKTYFSYGIELKVHNPAAAAQTMTSALLIWPQYNWRTDSNRL